MHADETVEAAHQGVDRYLMFTTRPDQIRRLTARRLTRYKTTF